MKNMLAYYLDFESLRSVDLHSLPSNCSMCSHEKTVGIPSTKTILWPSVRKGSFGIVRHLVKKKIVVDVELNWIEFEIVYLVLSSLLLWTNASLYGNWIICWSAQY